MPSSALGAPWARSTNPEDSIVRKTFRVAALALAALAAPTVLAAQEAPSQTAAPEAEIAQIQQRLMQIQQRAMQDAELQAAQAEVGQELVAAMTRVDPTAAAKTERASTLQQDVAAAREAGDNERLHELAAEAEQLQADFAVLRERAMQDEQMQAVMIAFQDKLVAKMAEIEPETNDLLARLNEIQSGS
jgi:hypothetical protein